MNRCIYSCSANCGATARLFIIFRHAKPRIRKARLTAIDIVYQDDDLVVLNKPAGLLSVPGKGDDKQDCLSARVQKAFPGACVVHRLDMATSGLMVMALNPGTQRALNRQFELRMVHKRYIAVVHGELKAGFTSSEDPTGSWRLIDLPIAVDWPNRPLRVIDAAVGKPSQTHWQAMGFDAASHTTRVALKPITGRSHQLRVHMLAVGHPILGDTLYAPADVQVRAGRLLLHAESLIFNHPQNNNSNSDHQHQLVLSSQPPF